MEFNVAIRTLMYRADRSIQMNVGGGVVYDSTAQDEYDEALLKSRFADLS
jgi:para-aminobenzoate synthetase component 1